MRQILYVINYYNELKKLDLWTDFVTKAELENSSSFITTPLRNNYTITRGALRYIISKHTSLKPHEIKFVYGKHGKPYLKNNEIFFNISHSHNILIIALSCSEIGVDTEYINKKKIDNDLTKEIFSNNEFIHYNSLSKINQITFFYDNWSAKESIIKLLGDGLNYPMKNIDLLDKAINTHSNLLNIQIKKNLFTKQIYFDRNYSAFISCYSAPNEEIIYL